MQRITVPDDLRASCPDELETAKEALSRYNPDSHSCHRCGKKIWHCKRTATYRRCITYVRDGERIDEQLMIPVCVCWNCGKSDRRGGTASGDYNHAILPDNLIPFTYFTLLFILTVLHAYATRRDPENPTTVAAITQKWGISTTTLYRWKKRYKEHYEAWAASLETIRHLTQVSADPEVAELEAVALSIRIILSTLRDVTTGFFLRFRFSFLQSNHLTHFRSLAAKRRL